MKPIQYLLAVVMFVCSATAQADSPVRPRQYSITSANGKYEFTMYTTQVDETANRNPSGHAYRIDAGDDREWLWKVSGWYSFTTFLSDDGRHLVRMGPWASLPPEEELAVAFYKDGKEYRRHSVADLIDDTGLVQRSVSHYVWQGRDNDFPRLAQNNRFQILTVENRIVTFDLDSGEILSTSGDQEVNSHQLIQVTREQADDTYFAQQLFAHNGIDVDYDLIGRVIRGPHETVVWTNSRFAGLSVFYHEVGYSFDANRRLNTRPGSDQPLFLGSPLPPPNTFPIDHRPDVRTEQAIAAYMARVRDDSFLGADFTSPQQPEVVLGFHNILIGRGERAEYRLAWRVRLKGGRYPVAMIGAKKGDVLFFDSGVRTSGGILPPAPKPKPATQPVCHDAVQDEIAWDGQGHIRWQTANVQRLCAGNEHSEEPANCFDQAMRGGIDRGDGTDWNWNDALRLCSGAQSADVRISCFTSSIFDGAGWQQAIAGCIGEREAGSFVAGALDTGSYVLDGTELVNTASDTRIRIPDDWLDTTVGDYGDYVPVANFDTEVNSFVIKEGVTGVHLSSYGIQRQGSAGAAAGRDVFLAVDTEQIEVIGRVDDLGVTKSRGGRYMGCFPAYNDHLFLGDINGDGATDIGVLRESLTCEDLYDPIEEVDRVVAKRQLADLKWYVYRDGDWAYDAEFDGECASAAMVYSPWPALYKGPVRFVAELSSRFRPTQAGRMPACAASALAAYRQKLELAVSDH